MKTNTLMTIGLAAWCGCAQAAEKEIEPKDLPAAVSESISKAYPQGKIEEALVHTKKGVKTYEAEIETKDEKEIELTLDAKGKILKVEEEIDPENLPASIAAAVAKAFPGSEIEDAEIITTDGKTSYEVEVSTKDGKEMDITLDPKGKIIKTEDEEREDEDPVHNKKAKS